jgi:hypothetical protein
MGAYVRFLIFQGGGGVDVAQNKRVVRTIVVTGNPGLASI